MPTDSKTETKTTTETKAAPTANMFATFDPMTAWTTGQAAFHQMMADAMARFASFSEDVAAVEHQMLSRAQGAVASWAQLTQDAIAYGAQLSAQARKLGLETARKFQSA
jgi:hypothetical protein